MPVAATVWGAVVRAARETFQSCDRARVAGDGGIRRSGALTPRVPAPAPPAGASSTAECGSWRCTRASLLRLDFDFDRLDGFHIAILLPIAWVVQAIMGYYYGLYRGRWINGSFEEVAALGRTVFATTAVLSRDRPALARDATRPRSAR